MLHLKNFVEYTPAELPEELKGFGILYFRSEDGVDFYEAIKTAKEDTIKILYRDNTITGFSSDASSLYPVGASLIEVKASKVPSDLALDQKYLFDPIKVAFTFSPEYQALLLEQAKTKALKEANAIIEGIQDKIDTGKAREEDLSTMKAWKEYRIEVRETADLSALPAKPDA